MIEATQLSDRIALMATIGLYGGVLPADVPTYTIGEAACYLRIPEGTVRSWIVGRSYRTDHGIQHC